MMKSSLGVGDNIVGYGEQELDANFALAELDKGLRSTKIGEQCEAIVRFPVLFEKYPFPILINTGFLKLADIFHTGSNFLRLWVLRVCQQSERHLDKILNIDPFIRKMFSVMNSNDPIARAITLRALGSLAGLIPERKPVHHSIRVALDSHDRVEVSAAIYAASCFAKRSRTFGSTMCTKIASMVQKLSTPIDLKLRLIPIFQHMHHDLSTVAMVRKLCYELLLSYPSEDFVTTTLNTLTLLAGATISDIPEQVSYLLSNLDDTRTNVKLTVLKDLKYLGSKCSHLWEPTHITILVNIIHRDYFNDSEPDNLDSVNYNIMLSALDVLHSLTSSSSSLIRQFTSTTDTSLWKLLNSSMKSTDSKVVLKSVQIYTCILGNLKNSEDRSDEIDTMLVQQCKSGIECLLLTLCTESLSSDAELGTKDLEKCLIAGVNLSRMNSQFCDWFCEYIVELMRIDKLNGKILFTISQSLGAIGKFSRASTQVLLPKIIQLLRGWAPKQLEAENNTVVVLVGIILQAHLGYSMQAEMKEFIHSILESCNLWVAYRVGRSCFRYGQPELAEFALKDTASTVSTESYHFWLSALHSIATADAMICSSKEIPLLQTRLVKATNLYLQAVTSLKAASSPTLSLQFQIEYTRIRSEMLVAFRTFLIACGNLQFSPPPAIAPSIISSGNKDVLLASGRVVTQLRKCVREFIMLSDAYGRLYQTAFDADDDSLLHLQILQQLCQMCAKGIERVVVSKDHSSSTIGDLHLFPVDCESSECSSSLIRSCRQASNVLKMLQELPEKCVTQQHIDCLKEAFRLIIETPLSYPRFFFQTLQTSKVKIAVLPQPRLAGESISVVMGNNLVLKVEGVIDQVLAGDNGKKSTSKFRKAKSIRITVVATPQPNPRMQHILDNKVNQEPFVQFKDVVPHRDFFSIQFLLTLWSTGIVNLSIEASVIDFDGQHWLTGPTATLVVKVYEDLTKSQVNARQGQLSSQGPSGMGGSGHVMGNPKTKTSF